LLSGSVAFLSKLSQCQSTSSNLTVSDCLSYTAPDGQIYNQSGIYSATIPNNAGCDSLISINLTIKQNSSSTISETVCKTYTAPDGQIYTQSGIYSATIPNNAGCDSLMTINLTVNNVNTAVSVSGITLTAEANGLQYQWINCLNNQLISGANVQSYTPIANGDYAVILIDGNCSDTSLCSSISSVSIGEITSNNLKVAPNPTSNNLVISGISSSTNTKLELCAITGELISTRGVGNSFKSIEPAFWGIFYKILRKFHPFYKGIKNAEVFCHRILIHCFEFPKFDVSNNGYPNK
jgi:hypothetical protein